MRTRPLFAWHRWTPWVLAAWLCVALGSAGSPLLRVQLAQHHGMEPACSAAGVVHWVPSPVADWPGEGAGPTQHGLDCPLCLPVLAPPPTAAGVLGRWLDPSPQALRVAAAPAVPSAHPPLPARGPPQSIHLRRVLGSAASGSTDIWWWSAGVAG